MRIQDVITIENHKWPITEARLFNAGGLLLQNKKAEANIIQLSMALLPSGIYHVAVVSAAETIYKQVIKQ